MIYTCSCGRKLIQARYADNAPIVLDAEPMDGGPVMLKGEPGDRPTAIFGIKTQEDADWYGVSLDDKRYDRHSCAGRL